MVIKHQNNKPQNGKKKSTKSIQAHFRIIKTKQKKKNKTFKKYLILLTLSSSLSSEHHQKRDLNNYTNFAKHIKQKPETSTAKHVNKLESKFWE